MALLLALKLVKFLSVGLFVTGCLGSVVTSDQATRRRFAFLLAGPGFGLTLASGVLLVSVVGHSYLSIWVLLGMFGAFLSLQGALYVAGKEGRGGVGATLFVVGTLIATFALMVYRPG